MVNIVKVKLKMLTQRSFVGSHTTWNMDKECETQRKIVEGTTSYGLTGLGKVKVSIKMTKQILCTNQDSTHNNYLKAKEAYKEKHKGLVHMYVDCSLSGTLAYLNGCLI